MIIGTGLFPAFHHRSKKITTLTATITNTRLELDSGTVTSLNEDLKKKNGLPLEIQLETIFFYSIISTSVKWNDMVIGSGSFPAFKHRSKRITPLTVSITGTGLDLDSDTALSLNEDFKKNGLPLEIQLKTYIQE
ncbi:hypothetical protein GIB67_039052 [Kingdonia uniflora]|uniref:Uncharacterized protein n=1 Tax=Kingdonia uniflora TaxID=39325 RepID=A0A7J7LL28_9MAGN|nr:hypothetical protein GIB67_039052 [Kingdonia uniflora]